ncbi:uncharacterized protein LOC142954366 [Anarhichas minor]|uniref:uncharacterized protein LOC142954366 n=1 Tax=Anarhichas minor TaxID=65739 RepID=UPI003F73E839
MAEKHPNSKLKRYKSSVKDLQPVISSLKRSHTASFSGGINVTAETERSAWWSSEQLPAEESLWALTLKSALPYLEKQHWDLVPDLPHPPAAKPPVIKLDEQRWCDLSEEVAPLPGPDPPTRPPSSHSRQSPDGKAAPLQALTKRPRPSLHGWEGPASSAAPSGVGGHKGGTGGEQEEETGLVSRRPLTNQVKSSDSRVSLQREEEEEEEEEVHTSVRAGGAAGGGGGGGGLQTCPMCLIVFPVGFTQMDCDGHLAQCLSEVNVDMTW